MLEEGTEDICFARKKCSPFLCVKSAKYYIILSFDVQMYQQKLFYNGNKEENFRDLPDLELQSFGIFISSWYLCLYLYMYLYLYLYLLHITIVTRGRKSLDICQTGSCNHLGFSFPPDGRAKQPDIASTPR